MGPIWATWAMNPDDTPHVPIAMESSYEGRLRRVRMRSMVGKEGWIFLPEDTLRGWMRRPDATSAFRNGIRMLFVRKSPKESRERDTKAHSWRGGRYSMAPSKNGDIHPRDPDARDGSPPARCVSARAISRDGDACRRDCSQGDTQSFGPWALRTRRAMGGEVCEICRSRLQPRSDDSSWRWR